MKGIIVLMVSLLAGIAIAQPHQHQHLQARRHGKQAVRRDVSVEYVEGLTVKVYKLGGKQISAEEAEAGIKLGTYIVIGETNKCGVSNVPQHSAAAQFVEPKLPASSAAAQFMKPKLPASSATAQFMEPELPASSNSSSSYAAPTRAGAATPQGTGSGGSSSSYDSAAGAGGLDTEFPSGKIKCSEFPSKYGAVPISWLNTEGWTSLQIPGSYSIGSAIDNIVTPIEGGCRENCFCSYACPPGYQKTQWPAEQGASGQSIGGVWCNADGYLELSRPEAKTLCEPGAGGVWVENQLRLNTAVCRTEYPGNENMVIPINAEPGHKYPLTNPDASAYYKWQGKPTSAQYYVNPAGLDIEDACIWTSAKFPKSAGNWAPVNLGVGKDAQGTTWLSIFANLPTSDAVLDFDIELEGDISAPCWLKGGKFYNGGNGCTTSISGNGEATFVFKQS